LLVRQYCELRIKSYETLAKLVAQENIQDRDQFEAYNKQIENLVKELVGPNE
jgi:hypothetical protein